jgi:biopolymer transport protein TolR
MGMSVGGSAKRSEIRPVMNVTPLVDVVLVLLIIFMVVTPLLTKQFWLNLPKKEESAQVAPPDETANNLVVMVSKEGALKVNAEEIPKVEFKHRLERMMAVRSEKVVYFDAEDGASYATVAEALDLSRQGGATTIAILTDKLSPSDTK